MGGKIWSLTGFLRRAWGDGWAFSRIGVLWVMAQVWDGDAPLALVFVLRTKPRSQKRDLHPTDEDLSAGTPGLGHPLVVARAFVIPTLSQGARKDGAPGFVVVLTDEIEVWATWRAFIRRGR